jgi:hypothetical protein
MTIAHDRPLIRSSLLSLMGIVFGSAVVVYAISPRRDPAFVPSSSNAGSQVAWAAGIPESVWWSAITVLALALASTSVLLVWSTVALRLLPRRQGAWYRLAYLGLGAAAVLVGVLWAYVLRLGLLWYLLAQSIID